jgi:hypothetical protein
LLRRAVAVAVATVMEQPLIAMGPTRVTVYQVVRVVETVKFILLILIEAAEPLYLRGFLQMDSTEIPAVA